MKRTKKLTGKLALQRSTLARLTKLKEAQLEKAVGGTYWDVPEDQQADFFGTRICICY